MQDETRVELATSEDDLRACMAVRREVFVAEQGVAAELEVDGLDGECRHFIARRALAPVGTARVRRTAEGWKIERVAVAAGARRHGVGRALVQRVLSELGCSSPEGPSASRGDAELIYLNAQVSALSFWEQLGFRGRGPRFEEASIEHQRMIWPE